MSRLDYCIGKLENIKHAHAYELNGQVLDHVFSEKDLAVVFDSDLTFDEHISKKTSKVNKMARIIKSSFSYLEPNLFKQFSELFNKFVRPHLEYAQAVWAPNLRKHINQIKNIQRCVITKR